MISNRNKEILALLTAAYPDARCELNFKTPYQLLVAVVLSAQCTDARVNKVTDTLFKVAPTAKDIYDMPVETLEKYIFTCGFYHNKAKSVKSLTADVIEKYDGKVPEDFNELTKLAGVGNKTASVVTCVAFHGNAMPVDTHVFRVSHRLGLSDGNTADKVMADLMRQFPPETWYTLHHTMIFHGRYTCKSQRPDCEKCNLTNYCLFFKDNKNV